MSKNYVTLGKYSSQRNRDEDISIYDLAESLNPQICIDLDIDHTKTEDEDKTSISIIAASAATDCVFSAYAEIDLTNQVVHFNFCDLFDNFGEGILDLSVDPVTLKLEITTLVNDDTLPFFKEYELFKYQEC